MRGARARRRSGAGRVQDLAEVLGGHELPTLGAYQLLFGLCAWAAVLAALLALLIPKHAATADAALPE
ncbi:hypothetical protein ACTOB_005727 [Actinoplanes oblitus]|uniref:Major facilitator superfamily (MFS) profile domain-containing protein n=1 Tax=Actinoplanes oblitus TaxID=3040509 RepID=A0ABY8W7D3_9ACTN|nr:hypothetical protein [Actinoplanes oblitus]WIM93741.1 hypothetical protein ACTOB_005727 [Actinoplanes oblitus]